MYSANPEFWAQWFIDLILEMEDRMSCKPYNDVKISENTWIREFDPTISESEEYVWHRDTADRTVTVLEGSGWQFQFDDEIPQFINKGDKLFIEKMKYHRLIPGTEKLKIKITET
jgi:quercetin dioxygenase-like cupin family protein